MKLIKRQDWLTSRHFPLESMRRPWPTGWPLCHLPEYLRSATVKEHRDIPSAKLEVVRSIVVCSNCPNSSDLVGRFLASGDLDMFNATCFCQGMSGCPGLPLLHTRIVLKYIGSWVQWYYIKGNGIMSSYHYYIIWYHIYHCLWIMIYMCNVCRYKFHLCMSGQCAKWDHLAHGTCHPQTPLCQGAAFKTHFSTFLLVVSSVVILHWSPTCGKRRKSPDNSRGWPVIRSCRQLPR